MNHLRYHKSVLLKLGILLVMITGCVKNSNIGNDNPSAPLALPDSVTATATINLSTPDRLMWNMVIGHIAFDQIRVLLFDKSGNLWAGGPGGVLQWDLSKDIPKIYAIQNNPDNTNVVALAESPDDTIWVGIFGNGIAQYDNGNWKTFTAQDGLPGNYVTSLIATKNGDIWVDGKKTKYDSDPDQKPYFGRYTNNIWSSGVGGGFTWMLALPTGSIVAARRETNTAWHNSIIGIYDDNVWNDLGLVKKSITAITVAPNGAIWVATQDGIMIYDDNTWKTILPPWAGINGYPDVSSIAVAPDGTAWFGFSYFAEDLDGCGGRASYIQEQGVFQYTGTTWRHFTAADGLVDDKICALAIDVNGNVWAGSFDKGISRYDGSVWKTYAIP